jgi:hypothetical protein
MVRSALLTVHPRRDSDATKMLFRNPGGGTAGVEVTATQTGHQKLLALDQRGFLRT